MKTAERREICLRRSTTATGTNPALTTWPVSGMKPFARSRRCAPKLFS